MSSYEELRLKNIADNKKILAELGILNPFKPLPRVIKKSWKRKADPTYVPESKKKKYAEKSTTSPKSQDYGSESVLGRRRSSRIKGLEGPEIQDIEDELEKSKSEADDEEKRRRKSLAEREMFYGAVPGVDVGSWWAMRIDCNHANIHRPTVAGIHPGPEGAYSIALSGGYEDDIDMGDCFTYTGEGGRDLKGTVNKPKNLRTAPQSRDQWLSRGNASLVKSMETGNPVRVLRGYKSDSMFAPEEGYRYDGLYRVEKYWYTTGMAGFGVYKFALRRLDNQAPPPWQLEDAENNNSDKSHTDQNRVTTDISPDQLRPASPDLSQPSSQDSGIGSQDHQDKGQGHECNSDDEVSKMDITQDAESTNKTNAAANVPEKPDPETTEKQTETKQPNEMNPEVNDQEQFETEVKGQGDSQLKVEGQGESVPEVKGQSEFVPEIKGQSETVPEVKGQNESVPEVRGQSESVPEVNGQSESVPDVKGQSESVSEVKGQSESVPEVKGQIESVCEVKGQSESVPEVSGQSESVPEVNGQSESVPEVKGQSESVPEIKTVSEEENDNIKGAEASMMKALRKRPEGDLESDSDSGRDTATPDSGVNLLE